MFNYFDSPKGGLQNRMLGNIYTENIHQSAPIQDYRNQSSPESSIPRQPTTPPPEPTPQPPVTPTAPAPQPAQVQGQKVTPLVQVATQMQNEQAEKEKMHIAPMYDRGHSPTGRNLALDTLRSTIGGEGASRGVVDNQIIEQLKKKIGTGQGASSNIIQQLRDKIAATGYGSGNTGHDDINQYRAYRAERAG
jgi:hypothetical protein